MITLLFTNFVTRMHFKVTYWSILPFHSSFLFIIITMFFCNCFNNEHDDDDDYVIFWISRFFPENRDKKCGAHLMYIWVSSERNFGSATSYCRDRDFWRVMDGLQFGFTITHTVSCLVLWEMIDVEKTRVKTTNEEWRHVDDTPCCSENETTNTSIYIPIVASS